MRIRLLWIGFTFSLLLGCSNDEKPQSSADAIAEEKTGDEENKEDESDEKKDEENEEQDNENTNEDKPDEQEDPTKENDNEAIQTGKIALSSDNELAGAYPEGMTFSAFPLSVDEDPGAAAPGTLILGLNDLYLSQAAQEGYNPFLKHPREKLQDAQARLNGTALSCFDPGLLDALLSGGGNSSEVCFGFDYGIINGTAMGSMDQGQINPVISDIDEASRTDATVRTAFQDAISTPETSGEACMVTTARQLIKSSIGQVEAALNLMQGLLCESKIDESIEGLPAAGEKIDLTKMLANAPVRQGGSVNYKTAEMENITEADAERSVFKTTISISTSFGSSKDYEYVILHSPSKGSNTEYDGVISLKFSDTNSDFIYASSVKYIKSGKTAADQKLNFEVKSANIKSDYTPFTEEGYVDLNAGADSSGNYNGQANDHISNIKYFAFDINPSTYAGNVAFFANPGGMLNERARGFIFEVTQNSDGTLQGCSVAGAHSTSIRKSIADQTEITPTGCFTPQISNGTCGNPNDNMGHQVWKQCFKQDTQGIYKIDTAKTSGANGFDILNNSSEHDIVVAPPPRSRSLGKIFQNH
jgi:hypothetical protein